VRGVGDATECSDALAHFQRFRIPPSPRFVCRLTSCHLLTISPQMPAKPPG
jgi:hypothetical protein